MGIGKKFSSGVSPGQTIIPGNPNPARFTVLRSEECGKHLVAMLQYHGVTNYEGRKVLVWLNKDEAWLRSKTFLDPHFQESHDDSPFARFEPTQCGWYGAIGMLDGWF